MFIIHSKKHKRHFPKKHKTRETSVMNPMYPSSTSIITHTQSKYYLFIPTPIVTLPTPDQSEVHSGKHMISFVNTLVYICKRLIFFKKYNHNTIITHKKLIIPKNQPCNFFNLEINCTLLSVSTF